MDVENYGDMVQSEKEQAERILDDFLRRPLRYKRSVKLMTSVDLSAPYMIKVHVRLQWP